jgi:hypothetical protein
MNDNVSIYGNSVTSEHNYVGGFGGGVFVVGNITGADRGPNTQGTLLMNGNAVIYGNTVSHTTPDKAKGGGVYVEGSNAGAVGFFRMTGGTVYGSVAYAPASRKNTATSGAAVYSKTLVFRNNTFEEILGYNQSTDYTLGAWGGMAYINDLPYAVLTNATPVVGSPTAAITLEFDAPVYDLAAHLDYFTLTNNGTGAVLSSAAVVAGTQNKRWTVSLGSVSGSGAVDIAVNGTAPHLKPVTISGITITYL